MYFWLFDAYEIPARFDSCIIAILDQNRLKDTHILTRLSGCSRNWWIFLIGVISKKSEEEIVREFFQLFKVPWEFYTSNRSYEVVLSTRNEIPALNVKLLLLYSSETGRFDSDKGITTGFHFRNLTLECDDIEFPIYGNILTFEATSYKKLCCNKRRWNKIRIYSKSRRNLESLWLFSNIWFVHWSHWFFYIWNIL